MLDPRSPSLFTYALPNTLAQFARVRGKIQTFGLFAEFDALNAACHGDTYDWGEGSRGAPEGPDFIRNAEATRLGWANARELRGENRAKALSCNLDAAKAGTFTLRTFILNFVLNALDRFPQRVLALAAFTCVALLGFGSYLQFVVGLEPCPMCIVQRYALILIAITAGLTSASGRKGIQVTGSISMAALSVGGAYVAARQSWLQWYPPEVLSCGRDFYGMVENFPLQRAIPMIFKGSGDCSKIDWTFLGGSIANWSFLCFCALAVLGALLAWRSLRRR